MNIQLQSLVKVFLAAAAVGLLDGRSAWSAQSGPTVPAAKGVSVEVAGSKASLETPAERDARMAWWRQAKFGMFIHWGVYSVPAGKYGEKTSYGEWIMNSAKIPVPVYREFAGQFNPVKYDPADWTRIAEAAGMKYIVITAKHHDGFALYPSEVTQWDIADSSPYGKDLLGPLVTSAQQRGIKIGFYYSQSQDWMHPGGAKSGQKEGEGWDEAHKGDYDKYLSEIAVPQVRELLTRYPIDILWWDTPMHMTPERAAPLAALLPMRPALITNNRLGGGFAGDTATPEQFVPTTGYPGDWETCMTTNGHWGYNAYDHNWKSSTDLIRKLADICSKGGNFLLNVGPKADGTFPPECVERLLEVGQWLKVNGEAIYDTSAGPFEHLSWGCATRKGNRLYLHVFHWPADGKLRVPLTNTAGSALLLADRQHVLPVTHDGTRLLIDLPASAPHLASSVVVLDLSVPPQVRPSATAAAQVTATSSLQDAPPENIFDGTGVKRWRAARETTQATLHITLPQPQTIAAVAIDEPDVWPRLKQKMKLEALVNGNWIELLNVPTHGHGLKQQFPPAATAELRLTIDNPAG
jgi:alpha-L-fucosidase